MESPPAKDWRPDHLAMPPTTLALDTHPCNKLCLAAVLQVSIDQSRPIPEIDQGSQ